MNKIKFFYLIFSLLIILTLTGCQSSDENLKSEKVNSEVRFVQNQCITIFNKYMADEYQEAGQFDWNLLTEDYNLLKNSIDVIMIDLASLQVQSKDIIDLEERFNELDKWIQSEDINKFMKGLCDIYELASTSILDSISKDGIINQEKKCKSDLLYIEYYVKNFEKDKASQMLKILQEDYSILNNNKDYIENNSYKVNRIYINIQKLNTFIENDDYENTNKILRELVELF